MDAKGLVTDAALVGVRGPVPRTSWAGDAKATLQALLPLLERKADRPWRESVESDVVEYTS